MLLGHIWGVRKVHLQGHRWAGRQGGPVEVSVAVESAEAGRELLRTSEDERKV